jgi:hypothetical protein
MTRHTKHRLARIAREDERARKNKLTHQNIDDSQRGLQRGRRRRAKPNRCIAKNDTSDAASLLCARRPSQPTCTCRDCYTPAALQARQTGSSQKTNTQTTDENPVRLFSANGSSAEHNRGRHKMAREEKTKKERKERKERKKKRKKKERTQE